MGRWRQFLLQRLSGILLISFLSAVSSNDAESYRLSTNVWPSSYDIVLRPNYPDNPADVTDFNGKVEIIAEIKQNTKTITLHAGNNIANITSEFYDADGEIIDATFQVYNETTEKLVYDVENELVAGNIIKIIMEFTGKLETDMHGFYKSSYSVNNNDKKETRILLTTQFQSTHARKAFPCFDEPKFKAKFQVTLGLAAGYDAISNTLSEPISNNEIKFKQTVSMSTYLLAFIIYETKTFGSSTAVKGTDDVMFKSWGRTAAINDDLTDYSQTISYKIISLLDEFTGIPYSQDESMMKIDQAAIPDFSAGAMENWGLVTYRETGLLFDEINSTEASRKSVSAVIAHELTHQWFGNLVTLEWWSYTWLNEGFARFFQYFILDSIYPRWRMMEQLVVDQQMSVFATDALASAVPLTREVQSPAEVDGQFSSAAYSKGGSVIRLLFILMGRDNFREGLMEYLENRKFDTATPDHLFEALSNHIPEDLMPVGYEFNVIKKWTTDAGYPVVTFERDTIGKKVTITQKRFYIQDVANPQEVIYPVNLQWTSSGGVSHKQWLMTKEISSTEALPDAVDDWFIVNNTGYFRVNYDIQNWRNLHLQLSQKNVEVIAPLDRATLVDNALNLARTNLLSYDEALLFLTYLKRDTDYIPWTAAFSGLSYLHRMLVNVDEHGLFNKFVGTLSEELYEYLGFQDRGDHLEKMFRANVLSWVCRVGVEDCHTRAVNLLTGYTNEGKRVSANLRSVAYCYGIKYGTDSLWTKLWQALQTNEAVSERSLLISALGCTQSRSTLFMYLEQSLSGEVIRQQDASSVFSSVYTNPEGVDVALDFLVENFARIEKTYVSMNALQNVVTGLANYLTKEDQLVKMQKLVQENPVTLVSIGRTALATIETNLKWLNLYRESVLKSIEEILGEESVTEITVQKSRRT